jgi:hypothetical protein
MRHLLTGAALAVALIAGPVLADNGQAGSTNWSQQNNAWSGSSSAYPGSGYSGYSGSAADTGSGSGSGGATRGWSSTTTNSSTVNPLPNSEDSSFGRGGSNQTATGTHCLPGERTCGPDR